MSETPKKRVVKKKVVRKKKKVVRKKKQQQPQRTQQQSDTPRRPSFDDDVFHDQLEPSPAATKHKSKQQKPRVQQSRPQSSSAPQQDDDIFAMMASPQAPVQNQGPMDSYGFFSGPAAASSGVGSASIMDSLENVPLSQSGGDLFDLIGSGSNAQGAESASSPIADYNEDDDSEEEEPANAVDAYLMDNLDGLSVNGPQGKKKPSKKKSKKKPTLNELSSGSVGLAFSPQVQSSPQMGGLYVQQPQQQQAGPAHNPYGFGGPVQQQPAARPMAHQDPFAFGMGQGQPKARSGRAQQKGDAFANLMSF